MVRRGSTVRVRPEGFKKLPANGAIELSGSETAVTRGHSRALSDVPSSGASAGRIRLVHADSSRLTPSCIKETCAAPDHSTGLARHLSDDLTLPRERASRDSRRSTTGSAPSDLSGRNRYRFLREDNIPSRAHPAGDNRTLPQVPDHPRKARPKRHAPAANPRVSPLNAQAP